MQTNGVVTIWSPSAKTYYADENGHQKKNFWFSRSRELSAEKGTVEPTLYNQILYFGNDFEACSGFQTIDGKLYYFAAHNLWDARVSLPTPLLPLIRKFISARWMALSLS